MKKGLKPVSILFSVLFAVLVVLFSGQKDAVAFADGNDRLYYFNMDSDGTQGNYILVESNGHFGLMDAGHRYADSISDAGGRTYSAPQSEGLSSQLSFRNGRDAASYMVNKLGVKHLDFIVGTHAHSDHVGGIPEIATTAFRDASGQTWYLVDSNTVYYYKDYAHINSVEDDLAGGSDSWHNQAFAYQAMISMKNRGAQLVDVSKQQTVQGDPGNAYGDFITFTMGNMSFRLYNTHVHTETGDENTNSIVTVMTNGNYKVVNLADISTAGGAIDKTSTAIGKNMGTVDVLVAGHHGYAGSNTKTMFDTLQPRFVVISNGEGQDSWLYTDCDLAAAIPYSNRLFGTSFFNTATEYAVVTDLSGNSVHVYKLEDSGKLTDILSQAIKSTHQSGWVSWVNTGGVLWSYLEDGKALNGWQQIDGKMYYLDKTGIMQTGWINQGKKDVRYVDPLDGSMQIGWQLINNKWYYFDPDFGAMQYGWQQIDGKMYFFDGDGSMHTGWLDQGKGDMRYLDPETGAMVTGWQERGGKWYYFEPDFGAALTGWQQIDGIMYYLNDDGSMYTGWLDQGENDIRYLDPESGAMVTGWQKIGGNWYYFMTDFGAMAIGWLQIDGNMYYFKDDGTIYTGWLDQGKNDKRYLDPETGVMVTGWLEYGEKWYYFETDFGAMVTGWQQIDGKMYYFNDDGSMHMGWLDQGEGKVRYLEPGSGAMVTGWQMIDGKWYYFETDYGAMVTGWQQIDGKMYDFNADGTMKTGWTDDGKHYIDPASGTMVIGWQQIDGTWYYFETDYGQMQKLTGWQQINGGMYFFADDGTMQRSGWVDQGSGNIRYLDPDSNTMVTGWQMIDGSWYYFETDFGAMQTGWQQIDGKMYYLNSDGSMHEGWLDQGGGKKRYLEPGNGAMVTGWQQIDGNWYYFETDYGVMVTGWQIIDGKDYYFYEDGVMAVDTVIDGYYVNADGVWVA